MMTMATIATMMTNDHGNHNDHDNHNDHLDHDDNLDLDHGEHLDHDDHLDSILTTVFLRRLEVVHKQVGGYQTRGERSAASIALKDE